jgi:hypothetical protein
MSASDLTITKNHFSGSGTVLGQKATFKGRIDAPDKVDEKAIKGVRLVATVKTDGGKYLRLVGFIPEQAQGKEGDDDAGEGHGRDRDRGGVSVPPVGSVNGGNSNGGDDRRNRGGGGNGKHDEDNGKGKGRDRDKGRGKD